MKYSNTPYSSGILATASIVAFSMISAPEFKTEVTPLLRSGLMQNASASRPEHLPGEMKAIPKRSTARSLLKHAGKWAGDDLDKCFKEVFETRGMARF